MRTLAEMDEWISDRGGVVHSTEAKAAGFSMHRIRTAVDRGVVDRVRRSWLARPGCDADLRHAATLGGRLTCLTQAQRLKLWTPDHDGRHVAVPSTASRLEADGVRLHWSRGPSPVALVGLEDPILNVLFHVARCVPTVDALSVWESAIRKKLVAPAVLGRVAWRNEPARRLAAIASELSDSGVETRFVALMRSIGIHVRQQVWIDGHPLDGLIGKHLAIQLDGFAHHQGRERRRDLKADARLVLRGYTVLRFDYHQVLFQPDHVIAIVSAAIAQDLHR